MEKAGLGSMSSADMAVFNAVSDTIGVAVNTARRTSVYAPINKKISDKKAKAKAVAAAALSDEKIAASELERWEAKQAADSLQRDKLVQSLNGWGIGSNTYIDYNRRAEIAEAFQAADDEEKQRQQQEKDALKENTKALKTLTVIASGVVASGLRTMAAVIPTYWQEHVSRSFWGSKEAEVARTGAIAKGAGEAGGALIGGIIGGIIGGPGGALVGAGIGGNALGTVGGLYGTYKEKELQAIKRTVSQVNERYRSFGIYKGQASVGYASSIEETGMASAGDVNNMVHNSATLGARMMFGQVGENEMLMYSLMPGYFAAAMSGATDSELAEAYKADVEKLPPQLRVWAAENVGGGSLGMLAYTQSPMWDVVQGRAGEFRAYDTAQMLAGKGYAVQTGWRSVINRQKEWGSFKEDLSRSMLNPELGLWQSEDPYYENAVRSTYDREMAAKEAEEKFGVNGREMLLNLDRPQGTKVLQTINVVVDGEVVHQEENEITDEMMRGGYAPTLTSILGVD